MEKYIFEKIDLKQSILDEIKQAIEKNNLRYANDFKPFNYDYLVIGDAYDEEYIDNEPECYRMEVIIANKHYFIFEFEVNPNGADIDYASISDLDGQNEECLNESSALKALEMILKKNCYHYNWLKNKRYDK